MARIWAHDKYPGTVAFRRNKLLFDLSLDGSGKLFLGVFSRFLQPLKRLTITTKVDALFLFVLIGDPVDDPLVEVITTEERVAVRGFDLEHAVTYVQDGDVERTTAQVIHGNCLIGFLVQAIS